MPDFFPSSWLFSLIQGSVVTLYFLDIFENAACIEKSKPSMRYFILVLKTELLVVPSHYLP